MKKLILSILGILTITTAFSQTTLKVGNDTLMCFTKTQLNFIVKDIVGKTYNDSILKEANNQLLMYETNLNVCKAGLDSNNITISEYKKLVNIYKKDSVVVSEKVVLLKKNNIDLETVVTEQGKTINKNERTIKFLKKITVFAVPTSLVSIALILIMLF